MFADVLPAGAAGVRTAVAHFDQVGLCRARLCDRVIHNNLALFCVEGLVREQGLQVRNRSCNRCIARRCVIGSVQCFELVQRASSSLLSAFLRSAAMASVSVCAAASIVACASSFVSAFAASSAPGMPPVRPAGTCPLRSPPQLLPPSRSSRSGCSDRRHAPGPPQRSAGRRMPS